MQVTRSLVAAWASFFISALVSVNGFAAEARYPTKAVRMVTAGAGGGNDFVARILAQGLAGPLGQQVIVDNRPSAASAGEITAKAQPDGYTLMYYGSNIWLLPLMRSGVPFDPVKD